MANLSINEVTTYRWSFEQDVLRYQAAGITAIGIWRQKLADCGEDKGIELVKDAALHVSNVLWAGGFTGSDGHSYQESLADARDAIALSAELAADCLVIYSGGRNGHTQKHARRLFADALEALLPLAEQCNVTLAVEPMHAGCADEWTFLTTLDETMALIHGMSSPRLKLVFDTYHLGHDPRVIEELARIVPQIAVVHLGDGHTPPDREQNRCCLGEGTLPLAQIIATLEQGGYSGWYDVELLGEAVENRDYAEILEGSKRAFAGLLPS